MPIQINDSNITFGRNTCIYSHWGSKWPDCFFSYWNSTHAERWWKSLLDWNATILQQLCLWKFSSVSRIDFLVSNFMFYFFYQKTLLSKFSKKYSKINFNVNKLFNDNFWFKFHFLFQKNIKNIIFADMFFCFYWNEIS